MTNKHDLAVLPEWLRNEAENFDWHQVRAATFRRWASAVEAIINAPGVAEPDTGRIYCRPDGYWTKRNEQGQDMLLPACGGCPGDGTICPTKCRLREDSPNASPTPPSAAPSAVVVPNEALLRQALEMLECSESYIEVALNEGLEMYRSYPDLQQRKTAGEREDLAATRAAIAAIKQALETK